MIVQTTAAINSNIEQAKCLLCPNYKPYPNVFMQLVCLVIQSIIPNSIERVSEIQGQINRYSDIIAAVRDNVYRRPTKVILTLHNLDKYDKMMYNQDIYVIYAPHNVIYENLQLPKTIFKRLDKYMT